jgi:glycerol-3-phosphate dehydrogenase
METEILIIGGGGIGCAVARELSAYTASVCLLERGSDVAVGASKANSGIVHAGFDAKPGSAKARFNIAGAAMYAEYCCALGVPYVRNGALVLAFDEEQRAKVESLCAQGITNGVKELMVIKRERVLELEPGVNPAVVCALYVPTSALASPYELTCALADHAALNGVRFLLDTEALTIAKVESGFLVTTSRGDFRAKVVVNCAGVASARLHNQLCETKLTIIPRKGEYYLLDHDRTLPFTHTMFQTPTAMGKGVLVTPTGHKTMLLGPSARDEADPMDVATTAEALRFVWEKALLTWPEETLRSVITTFAGIRAHEAGDDFVVGATVGVHGSYEAIGIESPGLSAAPAIAQALCGQIAGDFVLTRKAGWKPAPERPKAFSAMTVAEKQAACERDPAYGNVICRCEQVTEAEVRAAIRSPVGARTVDAVKRRTRAGMGRCQGGFCSPRVLEILTEELGVPPTAITKDGGAGYVLAGTLADFAQKGDA